MLSSLVGKGDNLKEIKFFEHAFKLYEGLDGCLREVVDIDKMQYGFMPGRGLLMLCLRRRYENSGPKIRSCFLYLLTWKKAFDWVPREVICFALRQKGVPEYLVNRVMSLYKGCKMAVSVDGGTIKLFSVNVGVHQESALSPLLFIMVMDVLTEDLKDGSLMELLCADNLILCGESLDEVIDKMGDRKMQWKERV